MPMYQVVWNSTTRAVAIQNEGATPPAGSVVAGVFEDANGPFKPDISWVLYHRVRDALYQLGVQNMQSMRILEGDLPPAPLSVTGPSVLSRTEGTAFTQQYTAISGTGPFTWSVVPTTAGITVNSSGLLSVAGSVADGTYNISVRVTDSTATVANRAVAVTILDASVPVVVPGQPRTVVAAAGDGEVTATWLAPVSNGGAPIDNYRLSWNGGAAVEMGDVDLNGAITAANGTAGTLTVAAHNSAGWGNPSVASNSVTPQAVAPVLRQAAPFDVRLTATQINTASGRVEMGNVSLGTQGDWSLFIQTEYRTATNAMGGGLLCIGTPGNNIFGATSALTLFLNGATTTQGNYFSDVSFDGLLMATAQDDLGNTASSRYTTGTMDPASVRAWPLVGKTNLSNAGAYNRGVALVCRAGKIELWNVDPAAGPQLLDAGPGLTSDRSDDPGDTIQGTWTSIIDKPMVIGCVPLTSYPQVGGNNRTMFWGGPLGQVVLWNGGAFTKEQMELLFAGTDARDVLPMQAARGDRYWPGSGSGAQMNELIASQHGNITGSGASIVATTRPLYEPESAWVEMPRSGVRQADPGPTTNLTVWGGRRGPGTTDVQMRLLSTGAVYPAVAGDVVIDWTTVASNVSQGNWIGTFPNVPNLQGGTSGDQYRVEVRSRKVDNSWTTPKRMAGVLNMGDGIMVMGQSIMQQLSDRAGPSRTVPAGITNRMHSNRRQAQISARRRANADQESGWFGLPSTYTSRWAESLFCELLSGLTGRRSFMANYAQSGSSIGFWQGGNWGQLTRRQIHESRPRFIVFNNGHGDSGMSIPQRKAALTAVLNWIDASVQSAPGGAYPYTFLLLPVTNDFNASGGLDTVRSGDYAWVDEQKALGKPVDFITAVMDAAQTVDGTHPGQTLTGQGVIAERFAQDIAHRLSYAPGPGIGGRILGGSWVWAGGTVTITLPITGKTGALVTRAGGSPSGFRVALAIDGALNEPATSALSGDNVILTIASASAPPAVQVTYQGGAPGTTSNGAATTTAQAGTDNALYDTRSTGMVSGLPGMPVMSITNGNRLTVTAA